MPGIHVLNQDTINKIAAGEVIERPMAVVKELMENAIDAGANAVTVEIKDGGKSLIRITDNGSGIPQEDIRLAFTPHATSKIVSAEDLLAVSTLGFRGEALASIASVSQLEMVTKTKDELTGIRYLTDGGQEKGMESIGCPEGTTFIVRNLFYNTPARLKFLKTPPTEAGYINTLMERLALSHPEIAFRFINQNQPKLHTSGNGNLKDVIYHIYGREIAANLIEVNGSEISCQVQGFIGKPVVSRGNRNFMNYFINGRYIKSQAIHKAIEDAYQPYSMQHRYPFTALHFTIDSSFIDINVHPQKMEIRFTDAKGVYQSVYHAVSEALKHREFIPEVTLEDPKTVKNKKQVSPKTGFGTKGEAIDRGGTNAHGADGTNMGQGTHNTDKNKQNRAVRAPEPFEKKRTDSLKILEELKKQNEVLDRQEQDTGRTERAGDGRTGILSFEGNDRTENNGTEPSSGLVAETASYSGFATETTPYSELVMETASYGRKREDNRQIPWELQETQHANGQPVSGEQNGISQSPRQAASSHQSAIEAAGHLQKPSQETLFGEGILSEKAEKEVQIIGQVFNTYWILQYEDGMYLVDQHAAHEKVLYERFMKQLSEKEPMTQLLQPPVILTLSMQEELAVKEHAEIWQQLGFQIEHFGGREYAVTGVPAHLPSVGEEELLKEVIDTLVDEHAHSTPEILLDKLASMSCKAAVKGNNRLPQEQMHELLRELMTLENPYHCPHGRPTMIKMTRQELDRKFKRIV